MTPEELLLSEGMWLGNQLKQLVTEGATSVFESIMRAIWDAALAVLRTAFQIADRLSVFTISAPDGGPVETTWPITLWVSGVVAVGLFFWQLTMTMLRGGRGFMRLVGGPAQYGVALAVTTGLVASMLVAADELTRGLLLTGLDAENFSDALKSTTFGDAAVDGVRAVVLGLCAILGVLPAAFAFVLEMLFREAAIHLLVAVVPITAAGLTARVSARWYWRTVRWIMAAILMKPVLALTLVLGVAIMGSAKGLNGLLVGTGVLLMSLLAPLALFRLFAFVDPNTDSGRAFRDAMSDEFGVGSYGSGNPVSGWMESRLGGGSGSSDGAGAGAAGSGPGGGASMAEARTARRFDDSAGAYGDQGLDDDDPDPVGGHESGDASDAGNDRAGAAAAVGGGVGVALAGTDEDDAAGPADGSARPESLGGPAGEDDVPAGTDWLHHYVEAPGPEERDTDPPIEDERHPYGVDGDYDDGAVT